MLEIQKLIEAAKIAREKAYVPYSNFKVGAAVLTKDGEIYAGCNIENHGIMSICAERVAFCKALSEGKREFEAIAVIGANNSTMPCGYCRQFMSEFVEKDFRIYVIYGENSDKVKEYTMEELLPHSFKLVR